MSEHETTLRAMADHLAETAYAIEATVGTPEPELMRQRAACLAGAEALRRETWQPIETAPKDGWVLLVEADGVQIVGGYVDFGDDVPKGYKNGWFDNVSGRHEITPTHWMPTAYLPLRERFYPSFESEW